MKKRKMVEMLTKMLTWKGKTSTKGTEQSKHEGNTINEEKSRGLPEKEREEKVRAEKETRWPTRASTHTG